MSVSFSGDLIKRAGATFLGGYSTRLPWVKHMAFDSIWCESNPERMNESRKRKTDFYPGGISARLCFSCLFVVDISVIDTMAIASR